MIRAEEFNYLDLVVYRLYSGELTDCCLPFKQEIKILVSLVVIVENQ